jgi:hypothetical protein
MRALGALGPPLPGFGHDTHGVENRNGTYSCSAEGRAEQTSRAENAKVDEDVLVGGIA